jgi:hypothetical protein
VRFKAECNLIQTILPDGGIEDIGVLLLTASDRLLTRFRRDFEQFAGSHAISLQRLGADVSKKADELGGRLCREWLRCFPLVRISQAIPILIERSTATTLGELYARYIRPSVLPFQTHLPQYSLKDAAAMFGREATPDPEKWIEIHTPLTLTSDMFVLHMQDTSMEPRIPDGSLCVFRYRVEGPWEQKVLLIQQEGDSGRKRESIRLCHVSTTACLPPEGEVPVNRRVALESINPGYESWDVALNEKIRALGELLFVV